MSVDVVRVYPEWLVLREPADAAARSAELAERLARHLSATGRLVIHEPSAQAAARWAAGSRRSCPARSIGCSTTVIRIC